MAAAATRASASLSRTFLFGTASITAGSSIPKAQAGCSVLGSRSYLLQTRENFSIYAYSQVKIERYSFTMHMLSPKRCASQAASARTAVSYDKISIGPQRPVMENDGKDTGVVYHGPISSTIKKVKLLSLSTCCLSVSLGPIITFMTSPDLNVIIKGAVASTVILMSASTTAALHWLVSPYIHKLKWQPGSDSFEVEMMSWMATFIPRTIKFADIRPAETKRPYVTFKAGNDFYFIDAEHCNNKALLQKLTPQKPLQSAFKNI